jgi:hypothetical protein
MAKQDLVVKLLLDSGAFGNDLRQAQKRAENFSAGLKQTGQTVTSLGANFGSLKGAIGALGGVMAGGAGIVAAFGAFKSVMESTSGTAKTFHTNIEGCKAVLDSFQISIAKMDFTNFIDGLDDTFKHAKQFKESLMDLSLGDIAYNHLQSGNMSKIKDLETKYRNAKTDSDREAIKKEAMDIVADMRKNLSDLIKQSNNAFMSGILSQVSKSGKITSTFGLEELLAQAEKAFKNTVDLDEKNKEKEIADRIMERYGNIKSALESTGSSAIRDDLMKSGLGRWMDKKLKEWSDGYAADAEFKDRVKADPEAYKAEMQALIKNNQGLLIRNALYDYTSEELKAITSILQNAANQSRAVAETELQIKGWSAAPAPKTEVVKEDGSIAKAQETVNTLKTLLDTKTMGSEEWHKINKELDVANQELDALKKLQDKLNGVKEQPAQLSSTPNFNKERKAEKNSIEYMTDLISNVEASRDKVATGGFEWNVLTVQLHTYREELEKLIEIQEEFDNSFNDHSLEKWNKKMDNAQITISSVAGTISSLGNTFSTWEKRSLQVAADITDMFGNAAEGIMEFISIQQAAATATGVTQAAKMPFPYNLAAIATVTSTILSVFDNIRTIAGRFAEGGIVGGTSYSGDKLFAMVNSGEMILNKRQQQNLGNMIGGGGQVEFHISGDSLIGVLNNGRNKRHLIS